MYVSLDLSVRLSAVLYVIPSSARWRAYCPYRMCTSLSVFGFISLWLRTVILFLLRQQRTQAYECRGDTVFPFYYESLKREWLLEISTRMLIPAVFSRHRVSLLLLLLPSNPLYCPYNSRPPSMVVTSLICLLFPTFAGAVLYRHKATEWLAAWETIQTFVKKI